MVSPVTANIVEHELAII